LRVTNVIAHGPGIKLLDGLAEASTNGETTYAYRCRPRLFSTRHGLDRGFQSSLLLLVWPQDSWGYSLAKEGAKREPDRAKHKEMPAPSIRCSEGTFYGRGRGGWFNNRLFFDQHHS